jgi:hypothetical protein
MAVMPYIDQLIQSIDGRIQELKIEIAALADARSALVSNGAAPTMSQKPRAKPAARQNPRSRPAKRAVSRRRASKVLLADNAERMLTENDGLTTSALADKAGADRDQVLAVLRDLEQARRVRRTGQRRATRWHAITDEDRIRERAAELASRTRPGST